MRVRLKLKPKPMSAFAIRVEEDHVFADAVNADGNGVIRGFRPMFLLTQKSSTRPNWVSLICPGKSG
jgi:hypothetical protein